MRSVFFASILVVSQAAMAQDVASPAAQTYVGNAYALDDHRLLYRELHYLRGDAENQRLVIYQCPDGRAFGRKHVRADGDAQAPDFDLDDARLGYREGVRRGSSGREIFVRNGRDQAETVRPLPAENDAVMDAGFDAFVQRHWQELQRGENVSFPFLVPSKLRFFEFKIRRVSEPSAGNGEMLIRLALDAWYSFVLPHIDVSYDIATHRLLRFEGLSNIRGMDGKNLVARIEFPLAERHDGVDPAAVAKAETQPLVTRCDAG